MRREVQFQTEDFVPAWSSNYSEKKFAIYNTCFLSTKKNTHELDIDEEILRKDAKSILGNFLVAKLQYGDASTHLKDEIIYGYFPREQEIIFEKVEENGATIVKAKAYCVISKMYGKEFNDIFSYNNLRNTSVEMTVETEEDNEHKVVGFDIYGLTCLGLSTKGSCPDANMKMVRFSEEDADEFFAEVHNNSLTVLKKFVEERKESMAEQEKLVSHPIDTSKEAMYDGEWEGQKAKQDLVKEKNFKTLAPKVCMKLEPGWEDREVTKLGYPVMMLHDGKWVYSTKGLASALGYAKKENETAVVKKVESIYKKLGLGKEDDAKMAETTQNFEIEGRKAWAKVIKKVQDHEGDGAYVDSIEDNHIIYTKGDVRYRVEADVKVDKDDKSVDADIKWDTVKKDADQKMAEDEAKCEDKEEKKMSDDCDCKDEDHDDKDDDEEEDFAKKCTDMAKQIEERDNIIMDKDKKIKEMEEELAELREFKKTCMEKDKACAVEAVMNEVKDFMNDEQFKVLRDEGMACEFAQIDAWSNKVKAIGFEAGKKSAKKQSDILSFSAPINNKRNQSGSVWGRL